MIDLGSNRMAYNYMIAMRTCQKRTSASLQDGSEF